MILVIGCRSSASSLSLYVRIVAWLGRGYQLEILDGIQGLLPTLAGPGGEGVVETRGSGLCASGVDTGCRFCLLKS